MIRMALGFAVRRGLAAAVYRNTSGGDASPLSTSSLRRPRPRRLRRLRRLRRTSDDASAAPALATPASAAPTSRRPQQLDDDLSSAEEEH